MTKTVFQIRIHHTNQHGEKFHPKFRANMDHVTSFYDQTDAQLVADAIENSQSYRPSWRGKRCEVIENKSAGISALHTYGAGHTRWVLDQIVR